MGGDASKHIAHLSLLYIFLVRGGTILLIKLYLCHLKKEKHKDYAYTKAIAR